MHAEPPAPTPRYYRSIGSIRRNLHEALDAPPRGMRVEGTPYTHSAALFWAGFLAETHFLFPRADAVDLRAPDEFPLDQTVLDPAAQLAADAERFRDSDAREVLEETIRRLAVTGPPPPVHATVREKDRILREETLDRGLADAELFRYLLGWMLKWAGAPPVCWGRCAVVGRLDAVIEAGVDLRVVMDVTLRNVDLSEGLIERILSLENIEFRAVPE